MTAQLRLVALALTLGACGLGAPCVDVEPPCDDAFDCRTVSIWCSDGTSASSVDGSRQCVAGRCDGALAAARASCGPNPVARVAVPGPDVNGAPSLRDGVACSTPAPTGGGSGGGGSGGGGSGASGGGGGASGGGGGGGGGGGAAAPRCSSSDSRACACALGLTGVVPNEVTSCSGASTNGVCCGTSGWPGAGQCQCGQYRCWQRDALACECILGTATLSDSSYSKSSCSPASGTVCCLEDLGIASGVVCHCGRTACPAGTTTVSRCEAGPQACVASGRTQLEACR